MTYVNDVFLKVLIEVQRLARHLRSERGQDVIEYALLGGLIAISIMLVVTFLTGALTSMITGIGNCIDFDSTSVCAPF